MRIHILVLISLLMILLFESARASTAQRDQLFGGATWRRTEKQAPKEEEAQGATQSGPIGYSSNSKQATSGLANLGEAFQLIALLTSSRPDTSSDPMSLSAVGDPAGVDVVDSYFAFSLHLGGTDFQGGGVQIAEAMREVGGRDPSVGLEGSWKKALSADSRWRWGALAYGVFSTVDRENGVTEEKMSVSNFLLGAELNYYFKDRSSGPYLRLAAGPSTLHWSEELSTPEALLSRSDASDWGWGSLVSIGISGSPHQSKIPWFSEFGMLTTNAPSTRLGDIAVTHFMLSVGLQFH